MSGMYFALMLIFAGLGYALALRKSAVIGLRGETLHSRPHSHGLYVFLGVLLIGWAALVVLSVGFNLYIDRSLMAAIGDALPESQIIERELVLSDAIAIAEGGLASRSDEVREAIALRFGSITGFRNWIVPLLSFAAGGGFMALAMSRINAAFRARNRAESIIRMILAAMATIAILTTIGIVLSLIFETLNFFSKIGWRIDKFVFGTNWTPLSGVHSGQMDPDRVGAVPLFAGTLLITIIAMLVAVPVGLFAAIYLSDFASQRVRSIAKPLMEILAGIPTVVYGFFAAITVAPLLRSTGESIGLPIASESALVAGVVMGIMIIPFISSLSDDVINAVPQALRDGSYGLGATKTETMRQVILPAALPGIVSAVLLGVSRAIGETMIVVMAAGQGANLTANPFEAVTTVTVQIVMLITGDTDAETAAGPAFTLGFTLFCATLLMNVIAQRIVKKYREMYD